MNKGTHTQSKLTVHIVWITKYRYRILTGEIQLRARDIIRQVCDTQDITIVKGVVSADHIHMHILYPPKLSVSTIAQKLKGRSAKKLLEEYPQLKKRYYGGHLWGIGYGAWSTGNITDEMVNQYLDHHNSQPNSDDTFILE
jgi:putative transposase